MSVGDVYSVVMNQTLHGQVIANVLHYNQVAGAAGDRSAGLTTQFRTLVRDVVKAIQSNELSHVSVTTQKIHPPPAGLPFVSTVGAGPGAVVADSLPSICAAAVSKRTAFAGRRFRGRLFVAGLPLSYETNSLLSAAGSAAVETVTQVINDILNDGADTFNPVIWHRSSKTTDIITAGTTQPQIRSMRRRRVGVGN